MTIEEAFEEKKQAIIGDNLTITNIEEAEAFHQKFIALRTELYFSGIADIMPHYRGEVNFGWDITPGLFRQPLKIVDSATGKKAERVAVHEFETVITRKIGKDALRSIFNHKTFGKDWDLLFQAQHAGVRTSLTDWSAEMLTALYFATETGPFDNVDAQLWCFIVPTQCIASDSTFKDKSFYEMNPFEMPGTYLINPSTYITDIEQRIFEYRMYRQRGRFVMIEEKSCHIPLNRHVDISKFLFQIRIPADRKEAIRQQLAQRNVIRSMMYIDENPKHQNLIDEINGIVYTKYQ